MNAGGYIFECTDCGAISPAFKNRGLATRMRLTHRCEETCPACRYRQRGDGMRGLCNACFRDPDVRIDYEMTVWRADDLLDTWDELRREGYTVRQAADRIGVTFAALDRALCRAKRRGDPRAVRPPHPCTNKRYMDRSAS